MRTQSMTFCGLPPMVFYLAFYLGLELELALVEGLDSPEYLEGLKGLFYRLHWKEPVEGPEAPAKRPR